MLLAAWLWGCFALLPTPSVSQPAPIVWARMGGRTWAECRAIERDAKMLDLRIDAEDGGTTDPKWRSYAAKCPGWPTILAIAARLEIHATLVPEGQLALDKPLDAHVRAHREAVERALAWVSTALVEAKRAGELPPPESLFYRAYALLALERLDASELALRETARKGDVEQWRIDRLLGLLLLMRGDLDAAMQVAARAVRDAPAEHQELSRFVYLYVLDRSGGSESALAELHESHGRPPLDAVESVLPIHERLFFRAFVARSQGDSARARAYLEAYLRRPEPKAPERVLAKRHLLSLVDRPAPIGGPMPEVHP